MRIAARLGSVFRSGASPYARNGPVGDGDSDWDTSDFWRKVCSGATRSTTPWKASSPPPPINARTVPFYGRRYSNKWFRDNGYEGDFWSNHCYERTSLGWRISHRPQHRDSE